MDRAVGMDIFNGNSDGYNMPLAYRELRGASSGEPFVIHKASQGWAGGPGGWIDWKLDGAIARARQAGFKRVGGYHWLLHGNPEAQADLFAQALDGIGGRHKVGAFVDYEENAWNQALNPQADDVYRFFARFKAIGGNPLLTTYTAPWYSDGYFNARLDSKRGIGGVWWAGYDQRAGSVPIEQAIADVTPGYMPGFDGWGPPPAIRQWTSNGLVAGVPSDCDVTYLPSAFVDTMFGLTGAPVPVPPAVDPHGPSRYDNITQVLSMNPGQNTDGATGGKLHVWQLSLQLIPAQYDCWVAVDGVFGPKTRAATVNFQKFMKLAEDGAVGRRTWSSMGAALTFLHRWIYDNHKANLAVAKPDHPGRLALPPTHVLHPTFHAQQGEHFRNPDRVKVAA